MREPLEAWLERAQRGLAIVAVAGLSQLQQRGQCKAGVTSERGCAGELRRRSVFPDGSLAPVVGQSAGGKGIRRRLGGPWLYLRSRRNDHLAGQATVIDFDVQFDGGQGEDITSDACGPGRAVISRIQTNEGVHQGLTVDQLLLAMALIAEPPAPPLRQEETTGSHEVAEEIPRPVKQTELAM